MNVPRIYIIGSPTTIETEKREIRDLCAIKGSNPGDIIGAEMVEIADNWFHDRFSGRSVGHMVQSQNVAKLMQKDSVQIVNIGQVWSAPP